MSDRAPIGGLSHVKGATDQPLLDVTIPELLAETVRQRPDREAVVFREPGIRWTWAEFAREVDRLAGGLLRAGIGKGDRVGIWSPNRPEWLLTQFATARIGAILVCINPAYRLFELEYALNKVGCKAIVSAQSFKTSHYLEMLQSLAPELETCAPGDLRAEKLPELRLVVAMGAPAPAGMMGFEALCALGDAVSRDELDALSAGLSANEPINVQFTSGTTGSPKGACLTHRNIINNGHFVTATMNFTDADVLCIPVPLYHCFGMVMGTLGSVSKGAKMVFPGEAFEPGTTLRACSDEKCTALYGVPTMFVAELSLPDFDTYDLTSLRTGIMAGAPCPIETMKQVQSKMNMKEVTIAYGMTETSPVSFQSGVDDPLEKRVSTVGRIHPHVECKIVDIDGETVPVGVQGEIATRGYSVMKEYWGDPEQTASSIRDGWMMTGDLGVIDADGHCAVTGRVKDMILRGGENVYPKEVEDFLFTHPDIAQAQVFGIPDARFGEIVCAWVVPAPGATLSEEDVKAFCRDGISYFKVPAEVRIRDDLPMTVTGKPQKFIMREQMIDELDLKAG